MTVCGLARRRAFPTNFGGLWGQEYIVSGLRTHNCIYCLHLLFFVGGVCLIVVFKMGILTLCYTYNFMYIYKPLYVYNSIHFYKHITMCAYIAAGFVTLTVSLSQTSSKMSKLNPICEHDLNIAWCQRPRVVAGLPSLYDQVFVNDPKAEDWRTHLVADQDPPGSGLVVSALDPAPPKLLKRASRPRGDLPIPKRIFIDLTTTLSDSESENQVTPPRTRMITRATPGAKYHVVRLCHTDSDTEHSGSESEGSIEY